MVIRIRKQFRNLKWNVHFDSLEEVGGSLKWRTEPSCPTNCIIEFDDRSVFRNLYLDN